MPETAIFHRPAYLVLSEVNILTRSISEMRNLNLKEVEILYIPLYHEYFNGACSKWTIAKLMLGTIYVGISPSWGWWSHNEIYILD